MRKRCLMIVVFILCLFKVVQAEEEYIIIQDDVYRYSDEAITWPNYDIVTVRGICVSSTPTLDAAVIPLSFENITYFYSHSSSTGDATFSIEMKGSDQEGVKELFFWEKTYTHPVEKTVGEIAEIMQVPADKQKPYTMFSWTAQVPSRRNSVRGSIVLKEYYIYDPLLHPITYMVEDASTFLKVYKEGEDFTLPVLDKEGYIFEGWCLNEDLSDPAMQVLNDQSESLVLYPKFSKALESEYSIAFPKLVDFSDSDTFEYRVKGRLHDSQKLTIELSECLIEDAYKGAVSLDLILEKSLFTKEDLNNEYQTYNAHCNKNLSAGKWQGTFFVQVKME